LGFAALDRRSDPDRRSLFDRRSPINFFSASDRVSTPLRRSLLERLSAFSRLIASRIAKSPDVQPEIHEANEQAVNKRVGADLGGSGSNLRVPMG
jgi:hypothetical protein